MVSDSHRAPPQRKASLRQISVFLLHFLRCYTMSLNLPEAAHTEIYKAVSEGTAKAGDKTDPRYRS